MVLLCGVLYIYEQSFRIFRCYITIQNSIPIQLEFQIGMGFYMCVAVC